MLDNTKFSFINIYAPNKENSQTHFYNYLKNQLRIHFDESSTYFLGGDFNYINDHTLDHKGGNLIVTKQYKHIGTCIEDILAECLLKDIWIKSYTWSTRDKSIQIDLGLFPKNRNSLHPPPPPLRHRFLGFFLFLDI